MMNEGLNYGQYFVARKMFALLSVLFSGLRLCFKIYVYPSHVTISTGKLFTVQAKNFTFVSLGVQQKKIQLKKIL